jgi:hypothetical protein
LLPPPSPSVLIQHEKSTQQKFPTTSFFPLNLSQYILLEATATTLSSKQKNEREEERETPLTQAF